ncbi:MAG TPA: hypothetical protein VKP30_22165 [Polyangiaceae bacterium]|nr:hypothetical protein [Polyangiaceae bacterium]
MVLFALFHTRLGAAQAAVASVEVLEPPVLAPPLVFAELPPDPFALVEVVPPLDGLGLLEELPPLDAFGLLEELPPLDAFGLLDELPPLDAFGLLDELPPLDAFGLLDALLSIVVRSELPPDGTLASPDDLPPVIRCSFEDAPTPPPPCAAPPEAGLAVPDPELPAWTSVDGLSSGLQARVKARVQSSATFNGDDASVMLAFRAVSVCVVAAESLSLFEQNSSRQLDCRSISRTPCLKAANYARQSPDRRHRAAIAKIGQTSASRIWAFTHAPRPPTMRANRRIGVIAPQ